MSWRHVLITNDARLSVKRNQLIVRQDEKISIPLQDIASVMIEARGVSLSAQLLSKCADNKVAIFTCDEKMMPNGIWTGFHQHSRQLTVLSTQLGLSKPFKKRIWQQIVQQKILNQAACLEYLNSEGVQELQAIAKTVESGDVTNREGYAAKQYFKYLFGSNFARRMEDPTNRLLNYGYAIMRGAVARSLVNYGFHTCIGIYHDNQLNAFNLADDFMEVFRPLVDYHVALQENKDKWTPRVRAGLVNLQNMQMDLVGEKSTVTTTIDEMVKSFISSCRQNDHSYLKLPKLLPLRVHQYE